MKVTKECDEAKASSEGVNGGLKGEEKVGGEGEERRYDSYDSLCTRYMLCHRYNAT